MSHLAMTYLQSGQLADAGFTLRSRHDRAAKDDAPSYGLWTR